MGGGGGSDVKNAVWMRALMMAGLILGIAVTSYVGLGVVAAGAKHLTWEDEEHHYDEVKEKWQAEITAGNITSEDESNEFYKAKEEAHHHEIEAHLSYLTYRVAGLAILFVGIIFSAFLVISGVMNSSRADEHHDEHEIEAYDIDRNETSVALSIDRELNDNMMMSLGLASVKRAPSSVELFMNGAHLATGRFEVGDVTLES